jgi:hypothetical protein
MLATLVYIPFHRNVSDVQAHVAFFYGSIKELQSRHIAARGPVQFSVFCDVSYANQNIVVVFPPMYAYFFFFQISQFICNLYTYINTISKLCVEKRGRVEECSVAPLCNKRMKTLCGWLSGKENTN